jgi:hypothetical protein
MLPQLARGCRSAGHLTFIVLGNFQQLLARSDVLRYNELALAIKKRQRCCCNQRTATDDFSFGGRVKVANVDAPTAIKSKNLHALQRGIGATGWVGLTVGQTQQQPTVNILRPVEA